MKKLYKYNVVEHFDGILPLRSGKRHCIRLETCIAEFPVFNFSYDQRAYEYLLCQSVQNERCMQHQQYHIRKTQSTLTAGLMDSAMKDLKRMILGWSVLRKRQFVRFDLGTQRR